jgi:hypothetical protein
LIIAFLYLDNVRFQKVIKEEENENSPKAPVKASSPLANIFHLYNHRSEKEWLKWMNDQDKETRIQACNMITAHLEDSPKHWGYITLEALECLKGFKDLYVDHHVGKFFNTASRLWGEYKSIPNYYQKAAEVLCFLNEQSALNLLKEEFTKTASSNIAQEKKRIIINILPELNDLAVPMMTEIITDFKETPQTRIHAFRNIKKFTIEASKKITLETTRALVNKYRGNNREIKSDDLQLIHDIFKEVVRFIADIEFFEVIDKACKSFTLQEHMVEQVISRIESPDAKLGALELYAFIQLEDNVQNEIKRVLAKNHNLEINEINNIIIQRTKKNLAETNLINTNLEDDTLPIPDVFKSHIKDMHKLFTQTANDQIQKCEKASGGILITGDASLEKLYLLNEL